MMPNRKMLIHATTVTGLGGTRVVQSLLDSIAQSADLRQTVVCVPNGAL